MVVLRLRVVREMIVKIGSCWFGGLWRDVI